MPWIKSLNTKLLIIVVLFIALSGLVVGLWQGALESRYLEESHNHRLEALSDRYQAQIARALREREALLLAAVESFKAAMDEQMPVPKDMAWSRDPDGAFRAYAGESGVFVHSDTEITPWARQMLVRTDAVWLTMEPLLKTQFSAFYFISRDYATRVWPARLVREHRPDHDVTGEIFYRSAAPDDNPDGQMLWTPVYFDFYPQTWVSSLLIPVYREDEFAGVMGADLEMAFVFDLLEELEADFEGLVAFIFSEEGKLVLPDERRADRFRENGLVVDSHTEDGGDLQNYIDQALSQALTPGEVSAQMVNGERRFMVHQAIPGLDWSVSLHYPESMLAQKHRKTMTTLYSNIIGMLLLLAIVLYYGIKWLVTDRVLALANVTRKIGSDSWALYVPERGHDEISQLSSAINRMLDKIRELFDGLNNNIQDMERLAYYDQLTGLQNRLLFKEQLRAALHGIDREGKGLALLYLDLDHFKDINDSLGHEAGDRLLVEVARRLRRCLRDEDSVARLGGDEFAILLRHIGGARDASLVASKIIETMREPIRLSAREVIVGTSIGITLAPDDSRSIDSLMKYADLAMYQCKDQGRNIYRFYTPEMNVRVEHRINMERDLRLALKRDEFELYFQPQIQVSSGGIVGLEALIRWHHPQEGLMSPDRFIPLAESCGLIVPVGQWVLRAACEQVRRMQDAGIQGVKVAVNVSARQLNDRNFVADFEQIVKSAGIDPQCLVLEVTESTLMSDAQVALAHLHSVRTLGVGLAIDDFGTGYSSLSYLKRLPVNSLKIDRSFVQDLPDDEEDRAITALIVAMAKSLRYQVVVEGVENEAQLAFLRSCGCEYAQGYYFERPIPADAIMELLLASRKT